jgi:hypothetical protein
MKTRTITCAALVGVALLLAACGKEESSTPTEVAVKNDGTASIDAKVSDGDTELSFANVAAGTTSSFQTASFGALSALTVTVGTQSSTVDLGSGMRNVIEIGADAKVARVQHVSPPVSAGGDQGW